MSELKSCPFCGGEAIQMQIESVLTKVTIYFVQCINCKSGTKYGEDKEQTIKAWNTRPQIDAEAIFNIVNQYGDPYTNREAREIAEAICKHFGTGLKPRVINNNFHDVEDLYKDDTPQIEKEG